MPLWYGKRGMGKKGSDAILTCHIGELQGRIIVGDIQLVHNWHDQL
jgi:hypothetical protein